MSAYGPVSGNFFDCFKFFYKCFSTMTVDRIYSYKLVNNKNIKLIRPNLYYQVSPTQIGKHTLRAQIALRSFCAIIYIEYQMENMY